MYKRQAEGWATLEPGRHVLLCYFPDASGVSHLHHGMAREIEVVDDGTPVAAPTDVVGSFTLDDFSIALPEAGVGAGVHAFVNEGDEPHEVIFLRMEEGKTLADAAAYVAGGMQGPAPYRFAGGPGAIAPGLTTWARLDLEPGDYLAVCAVVSQTEHAAHVDLGMVAPFTVG